MFDDLRKNWGSFTIIGLLILNCLFQNVIYYYFIFIYFNEASSSLAITSLIILIITKLIWFIGLTSREWDNIRYDFLWAFCCIGIILCDFIPFGIIHKLMKGNLSWKWLCTFIVHILLVSFPMTIIHMIYLIIYNKLLIISILSLTFNMFAVTLLAIYFTRTVSWKISTYNTLSILVDFINVILKIYFIINFIYYGLITYNNESFWRNNIIYYCSYIYLIKAFIIGPLYAIWMFIFMCLESAPSSWPLYGALLSNNCILNHCQLFICIQCLCICILYIIITIVLIFVIWIITECIFLSYPFLIFLYFNDNNWKKCSQTNQWNYVMKYMNNSINSKDWRVRLYLLNYLFWSTNPSNANAAKFKDKGIFDKIQNGINWYINGDRNHETFKQKFDVTIFRHKLYDSNGIIETIAIEYAYFLVDLFDKIDEIFDIRSDALMYFCNSTHPNTPLHWYYIGKEFIGLYIMIPLHLISCIYVSFIYPLVLYVIYIINNIDNNAEIFWMISIYWLFVIGMFYFMMEFIKFFYVWWHCLYRDYIGSLPCMKISGFYEYIHSHKARINIIKQFFGPLADVILEYLGLIVNDMNKEDVTLQINGDKNVINSTQDALIDKAKDVKQILIDNNYISNTWKYKDFFGYKKTAKRVQNNERMVDNWNHYLFK